MARRWKKKITELHADHRPRLKYYENLKTSIAPGLIEMLDIPGLGPKKIQALNKKLGVDSIAKLESACKSGQIAELDGFGSENPGQHSGGHRAPPKLRQQAFAD